MLESPVDRNQLNSVDSSPTEIEISCVEHARIPHGQESVEFSTLEPYTDMNQLYWVY